MTFVLDSGMMTPDIEDAANAVRSILPSPYRLSEGAEGRAGVAHRASGDDARFAVFDTSDRKVCALVIGRTAAADHIVTNSWLRREDLPGKLREAAAAGGTVYVVTEGVSVR
jgi:hypothetical protein